MKSIFFSLALLAAFTFSFSTTQAADVLKPSEQIEFTNKPVTLEFWVGGVCGECKERIEKALDVKGIRFAEYNLDEHQCKVVFNPKKISEDEIHSLINAVGHDTAKSTATDEEYNGVNDCCKYRTATHNH